MQNNYQEKCRVLIVDDDREFADSLSQNLKMNGNLNVVGCAYDGLEALEMIKMTSPDVVILDLVMPNLDGMGVLERMKLISAANRPSFIVVSGILNDKLAAHSVRLGAEYFMMKPVDYKALIERIEMVTSDVEPVSQYNDRFKQNVKPDIETMVTHIIHEIGIPAHIKGYKYLRHAIIMVIDDMDMINSITKELYPTVAKDFRTTPSRVEEQYATQ